MSEQKGGNTLEEIFGDGKLSYSEFMIKAGQCGVEIGDVGALRGEYSVALHELRCKNALERELDKSKAKNKSLVTKALDMSKLTSNEEGVFGLSEQIEALKKSDPYLFEEDKKPENGAVVFTSGISHSASVIDPDEMDDHEYYRTVKKL